MKLNIIHTKLIYNNIKATGIETRFQPLTIPILLIIIENIIQ